MHRINQGASSDESTKGMGHMMWMDDYFVPDVLFESFFRRRFQMSQSVSNRLYNGLRAYEYHFLLKKSSRDMEEASDDEPTSLPTQAHFNVVMAEEHPNANVGPFQRSPCDRLR